MLELTHVSPRQYQAPTGEMVPLLQISPSNTDRERVVSADPDSKGFPVLSPEHRDAH